MSTYAIRPVSEANVRRSHQIDAKVFQNHYQITQINI